MNGNGHVSTFGMQDMELPNPLEKHVAESKWQFCNCRTCQEKRIKLQSLPGEKIDFSTFRLKDERY